MVNYQKNSNFAHLIKQTRHQNIMATAIKAIPTLHGEDAMRFRKEIERVDKKHDNQQERDFKKDPRYATMQKILTKAKFS